MHADITEYVRHEIEREDFAKGRIADAEPPDIGAERRHHCALFVSRKAAPLHGAAAAGDARLGMQVPCNHAEGAGRLMAKVNRPDRLSS